MATTWVMVTLHLRTPVGDNINPQLFSFSKGRLSEPPFPFSFNLLNEKIGGIDYVLISMGCIVDISTKKGDSAYNSLLRGARVPKDNLIIEAGVSLNEANSLLAFARTSSKEKNIKRIILQVQKHLSTIGTEFAVSNGERTPHKKKISEQDVKWLEKLVEEFEESLALPPGFIAFGQKEVSSHMDVARTSVRKVERMTTRMKGENMIENPFILKYLNRLSNLFFLLACFEEKPKMNRSLFPHKGASFLKYNWEIAIGLTILALIVAMIVLLLFHNANPLSTYPPMEQHREQVENMHKSKENLYGKSQSSNRNTDSSEYFDISDTGYIKWMVLGQQRLSKYYHGSVC